MKKFMILATSLFLILGMAACNTAAEVNLPDSTQTASPTAAAATPVAKTESTTTNEPAATPAAQPASSDLENLQDSYEQVYQSVLPSVVSIEVYTTVTETTPSIQGFPFDFSFPNNNGDSQGNDQGNSQGNDQGNNQGENQQQYQESGAGSGFVWDTDGHIITNNHVVDGADTIRVRFADGTSALAKVVGSDASSDLAVLKVDASASELTPIKVADSTQAKVGQLVIAIGNPFRLSSSMTTGIISGLGRSLALDTTSTSGSTYTIPDVIQTDAAINPGNSGGVLVDISGSLLGVTSAIESPVKANSGVGYVIPSIIVQKVVPFLIKDGSYQQPYIGISGSDLTPEIAQAMNLDTSTRGALVIDVNSGTPAEKAGLKGSDKTVKIDGEDQRIGGDVIVSADGNTISDFEDLTAYLARYTNVGQTISITYLRDGKQNTTSLTLAARPGESTSTKTTSESTSSAWLGITGMNMSDDLATAMGLKNTPAGVLIEQIEGGSPADKAGLRGSYKPYTSNGEEILIGGDIITAMDGSNITSMNDLVNALNNHKAGDNVTLTILRDGKESKVAVTLAQKPG